MSLKGFHILFITLAFLCSAGFWAWSVWLVDDSARAGVSVLGNLSGSLAIALFIYGVWFVVKKSKTILV